MVPLSSDTAAKTTKVTLLLFIIISTLKLTHPIPDASLFVMAVAMSGRIAGTASRYSAAVPASHVTRTGYNGLAITRAISATGRFAGGADNSFAVATLSG